MKATLVAVSSFDASSDSKTIHKACKGLGTNEKAIIDVLAHRSAKQRSEIAKEYKKEFGKDLEDVLKSELKGAFEMLAVSSIYDTPEFLARELHNALSGIGTNEVTLAEFYGIANNSTIKKVNAAYKKLYNKELENDLKKDTSGALEKLLVIMNMGNREESTTVDKSKASVDAANLWLAGEGRMGTNEEAFVQILAHRSRNQLREVFDEYERIAGRSITKTIDDEFHGSAEDCLVNLVHAIDNPVKFMARRFHEAMEGVGTKDRVLARLVLWRCELDLGTIKEAFQSKYGKPLAEEVKKETTGDFQDMMLKLIN